MMVYIEPVDEETILKKNKAIVQRKAVHLDFIFMPCQFFSLYTVIITLVLESI
jgi:hypothetical protein